MFNAEILAQVLAMKESGELNRMAGSGIAGILAQFALTALTAERDAKLYGVGFIVKGERVNPQDVVIIHNTPPTVGNVPDYFLTVMEEVLSISDRKHDAWDRAKAAIATCRASSQLIPARIKLPAAFNVKMGGDKATRAMFQGMNMMREDCIKVLLAAGIEVEE
ncbi:hypothetical protein ACL2XG_05510 [Sodalis sp. RH24]|uniref:hypothetical protein n=1 Tax=unclassified Sodalis (in: enterobacteria) TaxID=2636512 RepID=UPI0039B3B884